VPHRPHALSKVSVLFKAVFVLAEGKITCDNSRKVLTYSKERGRSEGLSNLWGAELMFRLFICPGLLGME
jgi:hypothetical protein